MTKMWVGPSADVRKACESDLFQRITRRCGAKGVFFTLDHQGRQAEVYTVERRGDGYVKLALRPVEATNPTQIALKIEKSIADDREFKEHLLEYAIDLGLPVVRAARLHG